MARRGMMIAGALLALLVVAGGLVVMTEGAQLLTMARVLLWFGPDEAARAWEAYTRPHALRGLVTMGPNHRLLGWPPVRWLLWKDRLATRHEPLWRQKEMVGALGLGAILPLLVLLRMLWWLMPSVWFLARGIGRLTPGTSAGSARWATPAEARRDYGPRKRLRRALGLVPRAPLFVVGRCGRRALPLSAERQGLNILALGLPGEGKSTTIVIPNLQREGAGGRPVRSLIVADPKGECYKAAGAILAARGYNVKRLDFYDERAGAPGYNPLAHIHTASEALVFARAWITNTRGQGEVSGSDAFWDSTGYLLLQSAILHLNHQYRARTGHAAPLIRLLALFNTEKWDTLKDELLGSPCPEAVEAIRGFMGGIDMTPRVGGSALVGLIVKFSVLNDPAIARTTAHDAIDVQAINDPTAPPLALFVILTPGMEEVLRPLTGCLFMQVFDELVAVANARPDQKLTRGVFCYLDEVGTVGVIAGLPRRLATLRSAGAPMLLACQDTIQLDTLYGPEGRRLITSTCQCHIIFAGVGQEDAAWVSTRLGTATVVGRGASAGRNREQLLVGQGGYNRGEVGRPLMTPEEIQQLPEGYMILNGLHARPILLRALPWYKVRRLRRLVARTQTRQRMAPAVGAAVDVPPMAPLAERLGPTDAQPGPVESVEAAPAQPPVDVYEAPATAPIVAPSVTTATTPRAKAPATRRQPRVTVPDDDPFATASSDD